MLDTRRASNAAGDHGEPVSGDQAQRPLVISIRLYLYSQGSLY